MSTDKIFKAFFDAQMSTLDYNFIKKSTKLSYSSLQNSLRKLVDNNILTKKKKGSDLSYTLIQDKEAEFSKISFRILNDLSEDIKTPLLKFIKQVPTSIHSMIIFGDCANKKETNESSLNILVILENFASQELQEMYDNEMKTTIDKINVSTKYPIALSYTTKAIFKRLTDPVLEDAKETGFAVVNSLKYYTDF